MKNELDILTGLDEENAPQTGNITAAAIAWAAQNLFSLALLAYSFRIPDFDAMEYYMKITVLLPLLIGRFIPLLALILFLRRRKSGWILTMICCVFSIFDMYAAAWQMVQGLHQDLDGGFIPTAGFLFIFLFSILTFALLLFNSVRAYYNITVQVLIRSVTAGILLVMLLRFLISKLIG